MDLFQILLAITGVVATTFFLHRNWKASSRAPNSGRKSPPEPTGAWPLIGHLHKLGGPNSLHRNLAELADKYGPVFKIRLGIQQAVVVSNWEAVKECFTTHDKAFGNRPTSSAGVYLGYNYAGFGFAPCGPFWREMRKLVLSEVLSSRRLEMLKHIRISEIETSIKELYSDITKNDGASPAKVVISEWIEQLTLNIIMRTIAGRRYTEDGSKKEAQHFKRVVKEFMYTSAQFVVSDIIPIPLLRWLDPNGIIKEMKRIAKEVDAMCETWIDEHVERRMRNKSGPEDDKDFIDVLLSKIEDGSTYGHSRDTVIKATITNIILAGSDTTAINLIWVLSLLLNNRDAMRKAQEEIDKNVGKERWVEETDIKHLVYLQAVVKETLRLYPPGPLSVPHQSIENCEVTGYSIPKDTRLFVNVWKLHRDPRIWSEPEKFLPERFLTRQAELDVSGQHFEFTPFGSGRRSCPGITFAMQVTQLTLARVLQGFDLITPSNLPVDMMEGQGMTLSKVNPVEVLMNPRLPSALYEN